MRCVDNESEHDPIPDSLVVTYPFVVAQLGSGYPANGTTKSITTNWACGTVVEDS